MGYSDVCQSKTEPLLPAQACRLWTLRGLFTVSLQSERPHADLPSASLWMLLVKVMFASIHTFLQSLPCDQQGTHSSDKPLVQPGGQQKLLPLIAGSSRGGFLLGWGAEPPFLASSSSFLQPTLPDAVKLFTWDSR